MVNKKPKTKISNKTTKNVFKNKKRTSKYRKKTVKKRSRKNQKQKGGMNSSGAMPYKRTITYEMIGQSYPDSFFFAINSVKNSSKYLVLKRIIFKNGEEQVRLHFDNNFFTEGLRKERERLKTKIDEKNGEHDLFENTGYRLNNSPITALKSTKKLYDNLKEKSKNYFSVEIPWSRIPENLKIVKLINRGIIYKFITFKLEGLILVIRLPYDIKIESKNITKKELFRILTDGA